MRFLDNVLEDFITKAPESFANAKNTQPQERALD